MRKLLLATGLLIAIAAPAFAACPTPLTAKDASGTTQNLSTTDDVSGYCAANVMIMDSAGTNLLGVNSSHQILVAPLVAGSAVIGKAGIDQTTAGTTNGISIVGVNAATALAGAGAVGTGAQRVAVGQDTTTIAGSAPGTAGSASANVLTVQGVASMTPISVTGTFYQTTQPISIASGQVASGAYASGSIASGAYASGSIAAGAMVDIGTGGSPAANTVNARLVTINTTLGTPMQATGGTVGLVAGSAIVGSVKVTDGTNTAAVKAASTAAAATDPALVITQSPNGMAATTAGTDPGYGFPVVAKYNTATPAPTNGQTVALQADISGRLITSPGLASSFVEGATSVTGTSSTSLIASGGSGNYIYVTSFSCFNSGASGTTVSLQNGSGGTTFWEGYAPASGGGFTLSFSPPIGGENLSTATAVYFAAGTSTSTLYCNASGYKGL
jgi:hypothetical protein